MKISHKWLRTYFDTDLPSPEKLSELFTFHFSEVEGVEEVKDATGKVDSIFDLKILPDRAHYALSHHGVAQEVAALTGLKMKERYMPSFVGTSPETVRMSIADKKFCRRMIVRTIESFDNTISPPWLKSALEAVGQRSISPVVDITNYVMLDIGQPLHAFDADKVSGEMVVRMAKEGEKLVLLNGKEITLTALDGVIADDNGPLDIAGVKGGKRAEVTAATKKIILISDNFDPTMIRKSALRHDLRNEAAKRFENEITTELATHGMSNASALLKEVFPGAVFGAITDMYPVKPTKTTLVFDPKYIANRLGIEIPEKEIGRILTSLGIENNNWTLTIPFERLDLVIPEDIVEEVGRIYGYDKIKGILPPPISKPPSVLPAFYVAEKIKNILIGAGFSEVMLYTFVSNGVVEIAKPLAADKGFARDNLSANMLECLQKNALNADLLGLDTVKIFEIGKVFRNDGESLRLCIGVAQVKKVKGRNSKVIIEETLGLLATQAGLKQFNSTLSTSGTFSIEEINLEPLIPKISPPSSYADLAFGRASNVRFKPFSSYPFTTRDIALFVPEGVSEKEVWDEIEKGIKDEDAMDWLARNELFDVFKKDGKISYAFRMVFQSMEQTLTDFEVNDIMEKIYFRMKEKNWQVR